MPLLAIPFPTIDPVLISFGPLAIRWYALAYIAGILLAWRYMIVSVRNKALWNKTPHPNTTDIDDFVMWATLGIVLGGRLGYVLFYNLPYYLDNPSQILAVWEGGMAFHGGMLGMVVALFLYSRVRGLSALTMFDLAAIAAPIGLFFGRIANFINSELWGRPTDVAWAVIFPNGGPEPRHPSQLYEAALEGLLLFLLLRLLSHRFHLLQKPGVLTGCFAIGYGCARIFVEFYRVPDAHIGYLSGFLTMGMLLSLPMMILGTALVVWSLRRNAPKNKDVK
ncbi:Prolipoprotein diacylglyceryl transferase [Pseudovibrio axinellae]|uniref:Phosphatidylglycerol--prolipoprotein diacylglyceryl transferase n=1 Tax=Pseudovibrio axinellae TaxID=989403 RepID=A0A165XUU3_9HYPH|nr:prolipoprotein diacylglyceryl transferase [Pseudovibrio axinellae]KZL18063.1 Prolipoprotein diacylglyceryl transferase [Pseudovibrio axinellae]SER11628.1 Prolipoprotein diacylglyceryl transferase [Pseudovibrio axinellae]